MPSKAAALVDQRIGFLLPEQRDHWWEVKPQTDPNVLGRSVTDAVEIYGLPFLENYANPDTLMEILAAGKELPRPASNKYMDHAILLAFAGKLPTAKSIIDAQKGKARSDNNDRYEKNLDRLWGELQSANAT